VDALRVAYAKETAPRAPVREMMVEAPVLMGAAGANMSPCTDGDDMNGVEPRPEDAPSRVALTPGTSKGPGFSMSQEVTLDDVTSVHVSFNIVDLGTVLQVLLGYPRVPLLPASWGQVAGVQSGHVHGS
jgi:hypothetical protein